MKRSELQQLRKNGHKIGNKYIFSAPIYSIPLGVDVPNECRGNRRVFIARVTEEDIPKTNDNGIEDHVDEAIFIYTDYLYSLPRGTSVLQSLLLYHYIMYKGGYSDDLVKGIINKCLEGEDFKIDDLLNIKEQV